MGKLYYGANDQRLRRVEYLGLDTSKMNYDFFASASDKKSILDFIFKETNLRVFELYSEYGQEITEYKNTQKIISTFKLDTENHLPTTFNLWSDDFRGEILFRRIELDPKSCDGHTFRFATNGWGLIQLYLEELKTDTLKYSHLGHFNQKGALGREGINNFMGKADLWNWKIIEQASRKLKYYIHNKLAVRKVGGFGILPGADILEKTGIKLWGIKYD